MSDAIPSPASSPKKVKATKPKGEKKAKVAPSHPVYGAMIKAAIKDLKDRKGASKQAIQKFIMQKYKLGDNEKQIGARVRTALKKGVTAGTFNQASGTGAAGRFRLPEKEAAAKPKVDKKPKATTAAKPKKAAAKPKMTAGNKPKKVETAKKPKSPKKAAMPKSAKSPKKTAAKKASKPKTPRKPVAKKATKA